MSDHVSQPREGSDTLAATPRVTLSALRKRDSILNFSPSRLHRMNPQVDTATDAALSDLFVNDIPLLDVRAPVEFVRGAFPTARNLPLLDDAEREQIGIRYKQAGQDAAIALGHELVSGPVRERRVQSWQDYIRQHPSAMLYCFRGGQRSRIVQQWLQESGVEITRIQGGYKRMRRFLIDSLDRQVATHSFIVIAGKTGCGKTQLLHELNSTLATLDLEGRANHRGSAFGTRLGGQPSQIDFENQLAIDLLKLDRHKLQAKDPGYIFVEDESRAVGSLSVPPSLFAAMRSAPLAVIEQPLDERVAVILNDYILANYADFQRAFADEHCQRFADYLRKGLGKIRRRLGDQHYPVIEQKLETALREHEEHGDVTGHSGWISHLLTHYYDPMYDYQLSKKSQRLIFRGSKDEFLAWSSHLGGEESAQ